MPSKKKKFDNWLDYESNTIVSKQLIKSENKKIEEQKALEKHIADVLKELCKHYDIDMRKDDFGLGLAIALAKDFVPAMRFRRKSGVKRSWETFELLQLYGIVKQSERELTKETKVSVYKRSLIDKIKQTDLADLLSKNITTKTLQNKIINFEKTDEFALFCKIASIQGQTIEDLAIKTFQ